MGQAMRGLPSLRGLDQEAGVRIWLQAEAQDMRAGFDRLAERVREVVGEDPLSGHLFVFRSRRGDRLKILAWRNGGAGSTEFRFCPPPAPRRSKRSDRRSGAGVTNAHSAQQLAGPFSTWSFSIGFGPIKGSIQFASSGGVWALTVGPPIPYASAGVGWSVSHVTTGTITTKSGCR